jgi:hypothetical protein
LLLLLLLEELPAAVLLPALLPLWWESWKNIKNYLAIEEKGGKRE